MYFPAEKVRRKFAIAAAFCAFLWAFGRRNSQFSCSEKIKDKN
jgi:hypothetical protein